MKRVIRIVLVTLLVAPIGFAGYVWYRLQPQQQDLALPAGLVALPGPAGDKILAAADYLADFPALSEAWEAQALISYCGVASGVTVLNALGQPASQFSFFNDETRAVRSRLDVTFGGMSLPDLAGLLRARGLQVRMMHGDQLTVDEFRELIETNLSTEGDFLLVNYQREALGQGRVGHISPLGAYNSATDQVLIMDTADYKYPFTWVGVPALHAAMQETDSATGKPRGVVAVGGEARATP